MSRSSKTNQPVTSAKKNQPSGKSSVQASKRVFSDFDFDLDDDDDLSVSPLYEVDFSELELDSQEEFAYDEEQDEIDLEDDDIDEEE